LLGEHQAERIEERDIDRRQPRDAREDPRERVVRAHEPLRRTRRGRADGHSASLRTSEDEEGTEVTYEDERRPYGATSVRAERLVAAVAREQMRDRRLE